MNSTRIPLSFTLRDTDASVALESEIEQCAARLEKTGSHATRCSVLVEAPALHHRHGAPWHVRIGVSLPGREIVVERESEVDPFEAVRRAFDVALRRVRNHEARRRTLRSA